MRSLSLLVGLGIGLVAWVGAASAGLAAPAYPAYGSKGMVATSVAPAAGAGQEVLEAGGNAVDAAVATAFAASVAHQFSSGLGGGGFIVIHWAETGESFAVDCREIAPLAARPEDYLDADGQYDPQASRVGGRAVGVPGLVQGLWEVHQRFGVLPWARVVEPARRLTREGVSLGPHHRRILAFAKARLDPESETARIQLDDGQVPARDWKLVQPDLERTLDEIVERGPRALTRGPIADAIVAAVAKAGGRLTLQDLDSYTVKWREPVRGRYRGYEVVSMPPPSSGGVLLIQMLKVLEGYDLKALGLNSSAYIHLVSETMKLAFAERPAHLGDPDFFDVPTEWLISDAFAKRQRERLEPAPFFLRAPWNWGRPRVLAIDGPTPPPEDHGTTHISVMDAAGNAVALTQTVNTIFGSQITAPGTGIVLNNELDDFSIVTDSNTPNAWGLVGSDANALEPRKRPLSSMTPTIVLRDGEPVLVTGSPMGSMIISTVLQTVLNVIDHGLHAQAAVSAPRFHHQWKPDELRVEPELPRDVVQALEEMGHPVVVPAFRMGGSNTVVRSSTGEFEGGADPRRDSAALGF